MRIIRSAGRKWLGFAINNVCVNFETPTLGRARTALKSSGWTPGSPSIGIACLNRRQSNSGLNNCALWYSVVVFAVGVGMKGRVPGKSEVMPNTSWTLPKMSLNWCVVFFARGGRGTTSDRCSRPRTSEVEPCLYPSSNPRPLPCRPSSARHSWRSWWPTPRATPPKCSRPLSVPRGGTAPSRGPVQQRLERRRIAATNEPLKS